MKNSIRFLCASIGGRLLSAACHCAAAVLVFVLADGSLERDTAKQTPHPSGEKTLCEHPNAAADSALALAQAFRLEIGSARESHIRDLLSGWAARDAEAALSWVSALGDSTARRSARATVCLAVAEGSPRRAVVLALTQGADKDDDGGLLECLTMQWCEKDSETVVDWAREQPPGEWCERLLASASFVLSKSSPAAATHLVSGLDSGTVQDESAMAVLHQWAFQESSAALRWAEAFSEFILRERALAEISNLRNLASSLHAID